MVLPRPTVLRSFAPSRVLRAAPRTANRAVARRGYASGHDGHAAPSSDVPWAIAAIGVTIPTCWYLWPSPAHADSHHKHPETAEERAEALTHEGDEKPEVEVEEKETPESKGDTEGVQFKGKTSDGDDENKQGDNRKVEGDSKGGKKLRIDSDSAVDLGKGPAKRSDGSDSAASNKEVKHKGGEGEMSAKQAGLSTTATKHSTDITNDPSKSNKGEGIPETAKSSGTVSTNRPQVESKKSGEEGPEDTPNPEAAKENKKKEDESDDKSEEKSDEKSEDESEEKKDDDKKDE